MSQSGNHCLQVAIPTDGYGASSNHDGSWISQSPCECGVMGKGVLRFTSQDRSDLGGIFQSLVRGRHWNGQILTGDLFPSHR